MTDSLINNHTAGAAVELSTLIEPTNDVSSSGGGDSFTDADTTKIISPGSVVKYINLCLEVGVLAGSNPCWYEYALVLFDEQEAAPTVNAAIDAARATKTLGEICRHLYREKCIWFGTFPANTGQTLAPVVNVKMPAKFCKWKNGRYLALLGYNRPVNTTDSTSLLAANYTTSWKNYT